jgi:hypothetical protein
MLEPVQTIKISTDELVNKFAKFWDADMIGSMPIIFEEAVTQIVDKFPWLGRPNHRIEFTDASRKKLHLFILNALPSPINPDLLEPIEAERDELLDCIRTVGGIMLNVRLGRSIPHKLSIVGKIGR